MKNTYVTQKFIGNSDQDDLDLELQKKFKFDYNNGGNFFLIPDGPEGAWGPFLEIEEFIKILDHFRSKGATHVQIEDHCDHHGYGISGFEIREMSPEEIEAYQKTSLLGRHEENKKII